MPSYRNIPLVGKWNLSKKALAKALGVTERTINTWISRRYIPFHKIGTSKGARVLFNLKDVQTALARYEVKEIAP